MSYTRGWSDATPAGSRAANQIDDAIRELKVDLHQRFDSVLSVDWTTDPVVARPEILGNVTGKKLLIPGYAFQIDAGFGTGTRYVGDGTFSGVSSVFNDPGMFCPLFIPVGISIKKLRWRATNVDTNTLSMYLFSVPFTTGTVRTQEVLTTGNTAGDTIYDSGGIDIVADGIKMFHLAIDKSAGATFKLWGVEVTYDTPDCRSTY